MDDERENRAPMSDQEYVENNGAKCPFCGHDEFEGEAVQIDGGVA